MGLRDFFKNFGKRNTTNSISADIPANQDELEDAGQLGAIIKNIKIILASSHITSLAVKESLNQCITYLQGIISFGYEFNENLMDAIDYIFADYKEAIGKDQNDEIDLIDSKLPEISKALEYIYQDTRGATVFKNTKDVLAFYNQLRGEEDNSNLDILAVDSDEEVTDPWEAMDNKEVNRTDELLTPLSGQVQSILNSSANLSPETQKHFNEFLFFIDGIIKFQYDYNKDLINSIISIINTYQKALESGDTSTVEKINENLGLIEKSLENIYHNIKGAAVYKNMKTVMQFNEEL